MVFNINSFSAHPPSHLTPPTHPPQFGSFPAGVTQFTTTPRPIWPPPVPTHSTTKQPVYDTEESAPVGNFCGAKNGKQDQERIVGGENASPHEWPWVAVLFNSGRQFCGGMSIDFSLYLHKYSISLN